MEKNDSKEKIIHVYNGQDNSALYCTLAGITPPMKDYSITRTPSKEYIFEFVTKGKGYIDHNGQTIPVEAGSFVYITKGADTVCYSDPSDPYEKIWFCVDGSILKKSLSLLYSSDVYVAHTDMARFFFQVHSKLKNMTDDSYPEIFGLILYMSAMATKEIYFPVPKGNSLAEKIKNYMDANVYSDLSLDVIGDEFGITRTHVIRVFKKEFNLTPIQYLIEKRIDIAKTLLTNTVMSLIEISDLLRYANPQHFSSTFRSIVGTTPGKYRKENS